MNLKRLGVLVLFIVIALLGRMIRNNKIAQAQQAKARQRRYELQLNKSKLPEEERLALKKNSATDYSLHCALCGENAGHFYIGIPKYRKKEFLVYSGITHEKGLPLELQQQVFAFLEKGNIKAVHKLMRSKKVMEDGIDCYCPDCNKIYCKNHMKRRVVYDDGFYDCTYGTCPNGHERIIDD